MKGLITAGSNWKKLMKFSVGRLPKQNVSLKVKEECEEGKFLYAVWDF